MRLKFFLHFLFISFVSFSQNGKLTGKLILKDVENYKSVSEKTYIILKTGNRIDSVKVNHNLSFVFNNLATDTLRLSISPRTYPTNIIYRVCLKENEVKHVEIPYASICPYSEGKGNVCPVCKKNDQVIPIVYGFTMKIKYRDKNGNATDKNGKIISKEEEEKVTSKQGGCVITDCQPNWFCQLDNIDF
ncbi:hypothetical protein [Flavobacterium chungbukense]|uniref:Uncharacterized protein n=1 Tax=Flavobacterium chungbukense TaxID=877464 RepID=A0ABP7YJZ2_9FLAO|nr:hypothetical protein [Flavobacterium chungbukense]MCC4920042.1 hypothetical protein [Flavobacterium chungbukense]